MKLSPCKHCGAIAHINKSVADPHLCWSVQCSNLDCGMTTRAFSQQQHAVDAWQRCAVPAPTYSHRNGEPEAPTQDGTYWFQGKRFHKWSTPADFGDWREDAGSLLHIRDGGIEPYGGYWTCGNCVATDGQWWGPVQAPWEQ